MQGMLPIPSSQPLSTLGWGGSALPPIPSSQAHPCIPTPSYSEQPQGSQAPGSSRVGAATEAPCKGQAGLSAAPSRAGGGGGQPPSLCTAAWPQQQQQEGECRG